MKKRLRSSSKKPVQQEVLSSKKPKIDFTKSPRERRLAQIDWEKKEKQRKCKQKYRAFYIKTYKNKMVAKIVDKAKKHVTFEGLNVSERKAYLSKIVEDAEEHVIQVLDRLESLNTLLYEVSTMHTVKWASLSDLIAFLSIQFI